MSTLSNPAPDPSTPWSTPPASRAERVAELPVDAFTATDLADIRDAGGIFAAALADIAHHHIGDPGSWECCDTAPNELARLHAALDQMSEAIKDCRSWLTAIERRARRTAVRRGGAS